MPGDFHKCRGGAWYFQTDFLIIGKNIQAAQGNGHGRKFIAVFERAFFDEFVEKRVIIRLLTDRRNRIFKKINSGKTGKNNRPVVGRIDRNDIITDQSMPSRLKMSRQGRFSVAFRTEERERRPIDFDRAGMEYQKPSLLK